jgi:hypothetical protein
MNLTNCGEISRALTRALRERGQRKHKKSPAIGPGWGSRAVRAAGRSRGGYLLLRLVLRSPCWLLRLLLPLDALPRSLWLLLLRLFEPRLALPLEALLRPLLDEEDFELPDFMVSAPWVGIAAGTTRRPQVHSRKGVAGFCRPELAVAVGLSWGSAMRRC